MSENHKIIWVRSDQVNIPLDKVAELDKSFSRFPYLTQRQTISLAQHCSLHPDQVKVWFMAQRLCYGISWDSKDIHEMRRKMLGQPKRKQRKNVYEKENMKKIKLNREDECDAEEEAHSQTLVKIEQPRNHEKGSEEDAEEDKVKQNRGRTQPSPDVKEVAMNSQIVWPKIETAQAPQQTNSDGLFAPCSKSDNTSLKETSGEPTFVIQDDCHDKSPSLLFQPQVLSSQRPLLPKEELKTTSPLPLPMPAATTKELQTSNVIEGSQIGKQERVKKRRREFITRLNWRIKTPRQLAIMKVEFAKYQYPNDMQYKHMSVLTGMPRNGLVQWFRDMRYLIKKAKPRWLTVDQHRRAVDNVVSEQRIRRMRKMEKLREKRARKEKRERKRGQEPCSNNAHLALDVWQNQQ